MKKVENINLGGHPFTIDDEAFIHLKSYLNSIHKHFSDSEGCDEIMEDIESRMAELFQERMKGYGIITNKDLDSIVAIMGTPEEFGAESISESHTHSTTYKASQKTNYTSSTKKSNRRLFRDPDEKIVAGVCSGIASYLGVHDPLWVRIVMAVLIFGAGIGLPLYLFLWIIVPKAKNASDKLAMKGEPINVESIARTVEDELSDLQAKLTDLSKDFQSKKKRK
jgi:phage shock protein PspC (stress-responsive transcriptional regulator)